MSRIYVNTDMLSNMPEEIKEQLLNEVLEQVSLVGKDDDTTAIGGYVLEILEKYKLVEK